MDVAQSQGAVAPVESCSAEDDGSTASERDRLRRENDLLKTALDARATIEQAKGILIALSGVTAETAFSVLRRLSQDSNVKVRVVAAELVAVASQDVAVHGGAPAAIDRVAAFLRQHEAGPGAERDPDGSRRARTRRPDWRAQPPTPMMVEGRSAQGRDGTSVNDDEHRG